jgi:hypothetical protein
MKAGQRHRDRAAQLPPLSPLRTRCSSTPRPAAASLTHSGPFTPLAPPCHRRRRPLRGRTTIGGRAVAEPRARGARPPLATIAHPFGMGVLGVHVPQVAGVLTRAGRGKCRCGGHKRAMGFDKQGTRGCRRIGKAHPPAPRLSTPCPESQATAPHIPPRPCSGHPGGMHECCQGWLRTPG